MVFARPFAWSAFRPTLEAAEQAGVIGLATASRSSPAARPSMNRAVSDAGGLRGPLRRRRRLAARRQQLGKHRPRDAGRRLPPASRRRRRAALRFRGIARRPSACPSNCSGSAVGIGLYEMFEISGGDPLLAVLLWTVRAGGVDEVRDPSSPRLHVVAMVAVVFTGNFLATVGDWLAPGLSRSTLSLLDCATFIAWTMTAALSRPSSSRACACPAAAPVSLRRGPAVPGLGLLCAATPFDLRIPVGWRWRPSRSRRPG